MIRQSHPVATRWGGLAGGYAARAADLVRRRLRDAFPGAQRRAGVARAADAMSARLRLGRWLAQQERE